MKVETHIHARPKGWFAMKSQRCSSKAINELIFDRLCNIRAGMFKHLLGTLNINILPVVPGQAGGGSFHSIKKHKPIRTLGPIEKNHPPALSLTCLLLWSRQRMCWIAIPLTPSKYSGKCVLSLDLQSRFRNEFTSVLLGNVIEHIQKCIRISIAMGRRNHLPRKCMAPVTTAHILPSSIQRTCVHLSTVSRGTATSRI